MANTFDVRYPQPEQFEQEMKDVVVEFYDLTQFLEDENRHIQNYVTIRLVTIIEQFFRKIIETRIRSGKAGEYIPEKLLLDKHTFINIESITKETLIASSYSFQSVEEIKEKMEKHNVKNPFGMSSENSDIEEKFDKLFQLRHSIVHSVVHANIEMRKYYEMTENLIKNVLSKVHKNNVFFTLKSHALGSLGRHEEALTCIDEGLKLDPKDDFLHLSKGYSLGKLGRHEEALVYLDEGLKLKPTNGYTHFYKGRSLAELGRYKEALVCLDEGLGLTPDVALAYAAKGISFEKLHSYEDALVCFNKALELGLKRVYVYIHKGLSLAELGRHEEALVCFNKALELDPDSVLAYLGKGRSLDELGRHEEALVCSKYAEERGY